MDGTWPQRKRSTIDLVVGSERQGIGVGGVTLADPTSGARSPAEAHRLSFLRRERYAPSPLAAAVADEYRARRGLPACSLPHLTDTPARLHRARHVTRLAVAHEARRLHAGGGFTREVRAAYDELARQADQQFQAVLDAGVEVVFVTRDELISSGTDPSGLNPYPCAEAIRDDVERNHRLVIATLADHETSRHPLLESSKGGSYDRFRAVHDFFGHAAAGTGFDRHGEFQAWLHHSSMYAGEALRAATSELHVENSFLAVTGRSAPHFCYLVAHHLLDPFAAEATRRRATRACPATRTRGAATTALPLAA